MTGLEETRARLARMRAEQERVRVLRASGGSLAADHLKAIEEAQREKREAFGKGALIPAGIRAANVDARGRRLPVVRCAACKRGVHRHALGKGCRCEAQQHKGVEA